MKIRTTHSRTDSEFAETWMWGISAGRWAARLHVYKHKSAGPDRLVIQPSLILDRKKSTG